MKFKQWLNKNIKSIRIISCGILVLSCTVLFYVCGYRFTNRSYIPYSLEIQHKKNILHTQQVKYNLVEEIEKYISKTAPSSSLNALALVDACDEYNVDIIFVLAQGQIESHYGTKGVAAKTNSVFNVYSFDGVSAEQILASGKGYKHPDHSVRPYLELLITRYFVKGKTERDMFDKFINSDGKRYASAENYEQALMNTYMKIIGETKIDSLQSEYRKYKIISYQ